MLYLKEMSTQDLPDTHPQKNFTLYPVPSDSAVSFGKSDINPKGVRASWFTNKGLQTVELQGNCYVLNEQGKTIASHSPHQIC